MLKRIFILRGLYSIPGYFYEWQIFDAQGNPATFDYRGEAFVEGNRLCIAQGAAVYEYTISGHPTQESCDRQQGWDKARSQKRRVPPKNASSPYYQGWADCWRYRKGERESFLAPMDFSYQAN